jgi:glycosyltransferase involved in cell wall biosynthesis
MRVLLVNAHGDDPAFGGAERRVRYLAAGLKGRGHEVEILSAFPHRSGSGTPTVILHRSDWREDRKRRLQNHLGDLISAPWPRLKAVVSEFAPDVVHTHNLPGIGTGVWEVAHRERAAVVHSILDYYLLCPRTTLVRRDGAPCRPHPLLCGARTRRIARWAGAVDAVLGTSNHVLRVHEGIFPQAIRATAPPPLRPLSGGPPAPLGSPPSTLGYMGSLTVEKGVGLLLEAAPDLAQCGLALRLAGDGPLRGAVERSPDVGYDGHLEGEELVRFVEACDIGVVPSLWDEPGGGPFVLGEWIGAGRPVLTTGRGGLAEAEALGGIRIFGDSAGALTSAVKRLLDPVEWNQMTSSVPTIDADAELERWLSRHERLYSAAITRRDRSAARDGEA